MKPGLKHVSETFANSPSLYGMTRGIKVKESFWKKAWKIIERILEGINKNIDRGK